MSVESLHSAFQGLDTKMAKMITSGRTDSELASCLRREWSTVFHRDLSTPAVKGMVSHYRAVHRSSGGKRKTRKSSAKSQRGGMAPLDYVMGQGSTAAVYGQFPVAMYSDPSVIQSLDMNRFFESPIGRSCNATGGFDAPTQRGGAALGAYSNFDAPTQRGGYSVEDLKAQQEKEKELGSQQGGGFLDALGMGHMPASVPHNFGEIGVSALRGAPIANPVRTPVAASIPAHPVSLAPTNATAISTISDLSPVYQGY
jgi:hypothetical protein